jgi:hypothetical protein
MKLPWPFAPQPVPSSNTNDPAAATTAATPPSPLSGTSVVSASYTNNGNGNDLSHQEQHEWDELIRQALNEPQSPLTTPPTTADLEKGIHPMIAFGLTAALVAHGAILFSLPPVLRGKGAPFLPTSTKGLNVMFEQLRHHPSIVSKLNRTTRIGSSPKQHTRHPSSLTFVDLGSGDGRVVFRAARENMFQTSVGYEINPVLHIWSMIRKILSPKYHSSTQFYRQDLWSVNLSNANVVAVYGLHPIMDRLGAKMQQELKPGSIVVSNVFTIPGWTPSSLSLSSLSSSSSSVGKNNVHVYTIPDCFQNERH